jgi:hypothetical protein
MKRTFRFFLSLILLFSLFARADSDFNIVSSEALLDWGYKSTESIKVEQTKWETENFGVAEIYIQKIRSLTYIQDWKGAFPRFNIVLEIYQNKIDAENRLSNIRLVPPDIDAKDEPEYVLRSSFRNANNVYIVTTDVVKFNNDVMPKIKKLLYEYVSKNP